MYRVCILFANCKGKELFVGRVAIFHGRRERRRLRYYSGIGIDTKSYIPKGGRVYFGIKKPGFDVIFNMHYNLTVLLKMYILCNLAGNMEINIFRNHGFSR